MSKYWVIIYSLVFLFSCREKHEVASSSCDCETITIISKTKAYKGKTITIKDRGSIDEVCKEINELVILSDYVKKNINNGFIELIIQCGEQSNVYHVLYTVYEGVVIVDSNGNSFKNDRLEYFVRDRLSSQVKR